MKRFAWFAAPVILLLLWQLLPLATGRETLILRDILNTHLPMKQAQAEAMRSGSLPLVDVYRAGGQPLLGNPNSVPLYPDNVLYLLAPVLWALNAHFWLHWLVALLAMTWLGRAHGLSLEGSFAAGAFYALCGYFVSQLNLYNLVAVVALAPAYCAAALRLAQSGRRRYAVAVALLWALLCLAGEPILALLVFALALASFLWARPGRAAFGCFVLAAGCGSLLAAPQIVEVVRILPLSFRGHAGFDGSSGGIGSLDPRQLAEWFLPFLFGRPDRFVGPGAFWGHQYYSGYPALLLTLYPGLCAIAIAVTALRSGDRATRWSAVVCASGLLLSLGKFHPLTHWFLGHTGGLLRYPSKFFLLVALGGALLAGVGFERVFVDREPSARRLVRRVLGWLALLFVAAWAGLILSPDWAAQHLRGWMPPLVPEALVQSERLRWAGLCLLSLAVLAAAAIAFRLAAKSPFVGGSAFLAVHVASQLFLLAPALAVDKSEIYVRPPTLLAAIPPTARSVHGSFGALFGKYQIGDGVFANTNHLWLERRALAEAFPFFGPLWGRRFELNTSPDQLDAFLTRMARTAVEQNSDADRLRLLKAWGVSRLILDRELGPEHASRARLLLREEHFGRSVHVYEILDAAPEVSLASSVLLAPDLLAAFALLTSDEFDPRTTAVIQGAGPPAIGVAGEVLSTAIAAESLAAAVHANSASVLVWQRAHLPIYLASVDGVRAPILFTNFHRVGVAVPAGEHVVRIWADRRPLHWSLAAALLGMLGLVALGTGWPQNSGSRSAPGSTRSSGSSSGSQLLS